MKSIKYVALISGLLIATRDILSILAGQPPTSGHDIVNWASSASLWIMLANEVLAFEGFSISLLSLLYYRQYRSQESLSVMIITVSLAITGVLALVLVIGQGRLVYPIVGIGTSNPELALTMVAWFHGGMHLLSLLFNYL